MNPTLDHINPHHILKHYFCKIHVNVTTPSIIYPPLTLLTKMCVYSCHSSHASYMPCPTILLELTALTNLVQECKLWRTSLSNFLHFLLLSCVLIFLLGTFAKIWANVLPCTSTVLWRYFMSFNKPPHTSYSFMLCVGSWSASRSGPQYPPKRRLVWPCSWSAPWQWQKNPCPCQKVNPNCSNTRLSFYKLLYSCESSFNTIHRFMYLNIRLHTLLT
jgi:hypothetical protein